jgi:poly(3-hydroxybutyrate) depolymerase
MKTIAVLALVLCTVSIASDAAAARRTLELEAAGLQRRVLLYLPVAPSRDPPPLVVVYHGRGDDSEAFARAVKLHTDWPEAIVAYPRGEWHAEKRQRGWQYRPGQYDDRDLRLTDALLQHLAARYGTRPETTYAAGFSNGGHFVLLLMAERNAAFAAYAVIGSVLPEYRSAAPARPLLYLFGRGEDPQYQDAWRQTVEALVRHNRTRGPLRPFGGCCQRQMAGEEGGAPLVFGTYNAGHIWPNRGNEWLRAFFADPWFRAEPASAD